MALTPAERAKRHRNKKIGPGATTKDRVAFKKKRSAISTKSKKKRKEEQKEMALVSEKAKGRMQFQALLGSKHTY